ARVRRFAVDGLFEADFAPRVLRIGAENERAERATQLVVFGAKAMVAAIPGSDGLAGDVVQHPALTRFHARLLDAIAEHVVGVAHDHAALRILDGALVALDVQRDACSELLSHAARI